MKFYSGRYLALVFGLTLLCGTGRSSYPGCNPNNPPTLKRITNDMIVNRWFVQHVIVDLPNDGLPFTHFLNSYNLDFRSSEKLVINGRTRYEPQKCLYEVVEANIDPQRASFTVFTGYTAKNVYMRILDTDFHTWMIVWFCYRFDPNAPNECTDYIVIDLTIREDGMLSRKARKQLEQSLQKTVCRRELPSSGPKRFCDRLGQPSNAYGRKRNYW